MLYSINPQTTTRDRKVVSPFVSLSRVSFHTHVQKVGALNDKNQ